MLESICVGIDESTTSIDALVWADEAARNVGAKLRVIHAWEHMSPLPLGPAFPAVPSDEALDKENRQALSRMVEQAIIEEEPVEVSRRGRAGPVLVDESRTDDLLVLGRTGSGLRRLAQIVLGSTARYVLNNANVPVAVVPEQTAWVTAPKVFVGVDNSTSSCRALRWALTNLSESCEIFAVRALPYWTDALIATDRELFQHASDEVLPELTRCIDIAAHGQASLAARVTPRVEPGSPRQVFTDAERGMDLVIVGKHGDSGTAPSIIGSVADHVVRYAPCPVIVVPS